jgi:LytS/YehU family sensor histidine kinase
VNENEPDAANNYLVILSKLIRQNIENLQFSYISIAKELSLIRNYILLQNLRYDNKINLIINDSIPDSKKYSVPPLLIHTFVENSVVHGLKKGVIDFTITIDLKTENDYLYILVTDNGVGLRPKKHDSALADKTSLGIDFMRKRLSRLSAFYKVTFSLDISNLSGPGKRGTQVSIVLYAKLGNADKNSIA